DIQHSISKSPNGSQKLVSIGMKIIDNAKFPPMSSLEEAIHAFIQSIPFNFRNQGEDDRFYARIIDKHHIEMINASPHSDDMIYGYIYSLVRRFAPEGSRPIVQYADINKRDSDEDTIFIIEY
ncbi:MAG: hypothetical protein ACPG7F_16800, partial [Aggregatilineales bacterium]